MNKTFEESAANYGMPLYQALVIVCTIISGGLFYDEFGEWSGEASRLRVYGFACGIAILIGGIVGVAFTPTIGGPAGGESVEAGLGYDDEPQPGDPPSPVHHGRFSRATPFAAIISAEAVSSPMPSLRARSHSSPTKMTYVPPRTPSGPPSADAALSRGRSVTMAAPSPGAAPNMW